MKRKWVYDIETLDIFTITFLDKNSDELRQFVISKNKDNRKELFEFLENEVSGLIGYNCLHFDSQILEYMYRNPECTSDDIRRYAQIITSENEDRFPDVPEWKLRIPHLDLYKIHHFDNKNRRIGLKWVEFMLDLENIEDMPSQGEGNNWEEMVLSYNLNDVIATKELYKKSYSLINLRLELSKLYNIKLLNASNSKIGSELLLKLYCEKTGKNSKDVRSLRTHRKEIHVKDIIFDYIKFKSIEFNGILEKFKKQIITKTKKDEELFVLYKGIEFIYGKGGIHGSVENTIVKSDKDYIIIDADVSSLYPSIGIINKLYPKHLGLEFCQVYKNDIVDVRLAEKAKKENGNKAIVEGFKEASNACYGKSNDVFSWLYDPQYTMSITINGQLMLSMLAEMLLEINNSQLIQINTDGLTLKLLRKDLDKYYQICNEWMSITKLQLEYAEYDRMIIFDVNNYLAFYTNGKYKAKGRCEFENIPFHKNKSHNIIPIAFYKYFKNDIKIEDTIKNHTNIYDFCAGKRAKKSPSNPEKGQSRFELHSISKKREYTKEEKREMLKKKGYYEYYDKDFFKHPDMQGEGSGLHIDNFELPYEPLERQKLSKTVRYFISNKGKWLFKVWENGEFEHVEAPLKNGKMNVDWKVTYFNKYFQVQDFKDYDIDYSYYIHKTRQWIFDVEKTGQLNLF